MASAMSLVTVNNTVPRALCVSEIFSIILSYIHPDENHIHECHALSDRTFLALALTCHALSEPALDALWTFPDGIIPFMQCGGIIVPPKTTLGYDDPEYRIIPTEAQLAAIGRYAHRVRVLVIKFSNNLVQSFFQSLGYSSKVLVPNLRELTVTCDCRLFHLVPLLLGPRLQDIVIEIREADHYENVHTVLRSLPSSCPLLETIIIRHHCFIPFKQEASRAIQKMQKLRRVTVPSVDNDALTYLGGLSTVTHISSELPAGSDLEDILGPSRDSILFKNLDSVDWEIKDWRDVEVFTRLWPHKLTALQLRSLEEFDPDLMQVLFDSLHTREAFRYLRSICLAEYAWARYSGEVITIDTIRPLFYLRHLRSVDIDTKSYLNIDEGDLMEMAEAWPCLEVLFLNEMVGHMASDAPVPRYVTLPGVVRFVERCLLLKQLCISISLADVDKEYDMELDKLLDLEPRDSHATLAHLKLRCTREDEILELNAPDGSEKAGGLSLFAILLAKLFPGVRPCCLQFETPSELLTSGQIYETTKCR